MITEGVITRPRHRAIRDDRYKLVYEPDGRPAVGAIPARAEFALFDLVEDPSEQRDLLAGSPSAEVERVFQRLRAALETGIAELDRVAPEVKALDDETLQRLEALGYMGDEQP